MIDWVRMLQQANHIKGIHERCLSAKEYNHYKKLSDWIANRINKRLQAANKLAEAAQRHLDDPYDCDRKRDLRDALAEFNKHRGEK